MSSAFVDPRAAQWATAGHGRSPTLQLRHTIDDKLMIATHNAFLSLRAMFHRNLDNMILLSEEVHERKLNRRSETLNSKSFVITNKHVYLLGLPGRELFTPASLGACFQISELSRICSASESCIIILQFVNGVIAIQAASEHSANRIAEVLFSASGVSLEQISVNEMETAGVGSSHFSRDTIKYSVSVALHDTKTNLSGHNVRQTALHDTKTNLSGHNVRQTALHDTKRTYLSTMFAKPLFEKTSH
ncbi:Hypothetical protein, putative [Bodo saltans]|uniref:Uncharacterized protein n=1 Tax=Bodo saltans TaxID=75058 RepID=A0A0S4ISQ7_BODSA|nr:Hypothetical protein, putative [Bodo saltans]|eukprot:CUG06133.1 Hypothetical protein, putative [Bodo saltans]